MSSTLTPAFQFKLDDVIRHKLVSIGKYDGVHSCLTFGTSAGKIFIHDPHSHSLPSASSTSSASSQCKTLNINKDITSLTSGPLCPDKPYDVVIIGTQNNLFAYDVELNSDIFYRDVPDGINNMLFGKLNNVSQPLAIVGGNCSIQGFDNEGTEQFWTVTGDNVSALSFAPSNDGSGNNLIVGSDDFVIRIFKQEEVISEVTEADKIVGLTSIRGNKYGYALANGTIGMYDGAERAWRVKSKYTPQAIESFDIDADGVPELISGLSNGGVNVRNESTGEIVFKDMLGSAIAGIVKADYRCDGNENIIVCAVDGEVRGYLPEKRDVSQGAMESKRESKAIAALNEKKKSMMIELQNLDNQASFQNDKSGSSSPKSNNNTVPTSTKVENDLVINYKLNTCQLKLNLTTDTKIFNVILIDTEGGVFENDTLIVSLTKPSRKIEINIKPIKNIPANIQVQVHVGANDNATDLTIVEFQFTLPHFCVFVQNRPDMATEYSKSPPKGSVTFVVNAPFGRIVNWFETRFILTEEINAGSGGLQVKFTSIGSGSGIDKLWIQVKREDKIRIKIGCDSIELGGEVFQDMCKFLNITDVDSDSSFPDEMERFGEILTKVKDYYSTRSKLTADMADSSQRVKALVVKAEDARQLNEMKVMIRLYADLYHLNNELIGEYAKRSNNHTALLETLKSVNKMIGWGAGLRMGKEKVKVVMECRKAIKGSDFEGLMGILKGGRGN